MDVERRYFDDMAPLSARGAGRQAAAAGHQRPQPRQERLSAADVHLAAGRRRRPRLLAAPALPDRSGRPARAGFEIPNTPMVNDPLHSTVVQLSRSAVAGKPYTVSEVNHPFPNEYACEGIPILAAYAALHDWDGMFWYTLAHDDAGRRPAAARSAISTSAPIRSR